MQTQLTTITAGHTATTLRFKGETCATSLKYYAAFSLFRRFPLKNALLLTSAYARRIYELALLISMAQVLYTCGLVYNCVLVFHAILHFILFSCMKLNIQFLHTSLNLSIKYLYPVSPTFVKGLFTNTR